MSLPLWVTIGDPCWFPSTSWKEPETPRREEPALLTPGPGTCSEGSGRVQVLSSREPRRCSRVVLTEDGDSQQGPALQQPQGPELRLGPAGPGKHQEAAQAGGSHVCRSEPPDLGQEGAEPQRGRGWQIKWDYQIIQLQPGSEPGQEGAELALARPQAPPTRNQSLNHL